MDFLSKFFFNSRFRDEENEMNYIVKGYPLTTSPVIPDILKYQVEYQRMNGDKDTPILALALAHEGSDLVEPESLEVVRRGMQYWFKEYPELAKYFEKELPRNLLAVSFTHQNFRMGKESCHDFKLANGHKEAENSFYTYRKLSECVQCVYYNENGVEYPAGACFYPTPYGKPKFLESNDALLLFATCCQVAYPLEDRMKSYNFVTYKKYGRYCATAGRSMMVTCDTSDGIPRHWEYKHRAKKFERVLCYECCEDYFKYKWEEPKKDTPALVAPAITDGGSVQVPAATNGSEAEPGSQADSTESLIEGFEKIEMSSEEAETKIDAKLVD
ncbi:hypothetical protein CAEBREN_14426 [Caenorhabditis brenneri]|uniref:Uncharacterized protein n=1 Tax=Caenorhabditis brenneri TaxID=135651 RepID=G0NFP1_CAEBE|nr:hypothetical protein CAEBREN_14426 [Caenorhabditis brenneri]